MASQMEWFKKSDKFLLILPPIPEDSSGDEILIFPQSIEESYVIVDPSTIETTLSNVSNVIINPSFDDKEQIISESVPVPIPIPMPEQKIKNVYEECSKITIPEDIVKKIPIITDMINILDEYIEYIKLFMKTYFRVNRRFNFEILSSGINFRTHVTCFEISKFNKKIIDEIETVKKYYKYLVSNIFIYLIGYFNENEEWIKYCIDIKNLLNNITY